MSKTTTLVERVFGPSGVSQKETPAQISEVELLREEIRIRNKYGNGLTEEDVEVYREQERQVDRERIQRAKNAEAHRLKQIAEDEHRKDVITQIKDHKEILVYYGDTRRVLDERGIVCEVCGRTLDNVNHYLAQFLIDHEVITEYNKPKVGEIVLKPGYPIGCSDAKCNHHQQITILRCP